METRCCNDNLPKIRSRICAKRLVYNRQSPCPPYSRSPTPAEDGVVRVRMRSLQNTVAATFPGGHGRHGSSIHETLFEEISFGRPKSNAMKNMFCSTFEATPKLTRETISLETLC